MNTVASNTNILSQLSDELTNAVDAIAPAILTVHARRRMPATGISWSADGLVVTANHIVEQDDDITVTLPNNETAAATLVGRDPGNDLALLRIDGVTLAPAVRSQEAPQPGNLVLAIGKIGPAGPAVSFGIVSAVGKPGEQRHGRREEFIKADIAMLPGFSGGPLITSGGEVLGLNSSTLRRGNGLTIPVSVIERTVAALLNHGKVRRGFLGVGVQAIELGARLAGVLDTEQQRGLIVISLESGGPSELGGLLLGDIILKVNGEAVESVEALQAALTGEMIGRPVSLAFIRAGQLLEKELSVAERW